jgi:hypothetical protein
MSWRLGALLGLSFAAGYGVALMRKRAQQQRDPVLQNVAAALLSIHRFTDRMQPVLVPLAAGERLSLNDAYRLARELGV